jgi:NAD(P)H dehydrogenase (quinone)
MTRILITTGNGMFGGALIRALYAKDVRMRIMVRNAGKFVLQGPNAEVVTGDMDQPETLDPLMEGVDKIFLTSPMDDRIEKREIAVIKAAKKHGVRQVVKIGGAVRHEDDQLARMHGKVIDFLRDSGIPLTLISPNSLMETSFLAYAPSIRYMHAFYGMSGQGRVGLVALKDVAEVAAHVLTTSGHDGRNYEITGPEAIDMYEVAKRFTDVLGTRIRYVDLEEDKLIRMMMKYEKSLTPEKLDIEVLCHLRAWREGRADLVTTTFEELTGRKPAPLAEFITENLDTFKKGMVPSFLAWFLRMGN